jgi:hypothetical protein
MFFFVVSRDVVVMLLFPDKLSFSFPYECQRRSDYLQLNKQPNIEKDNIVTERKVGKKNYYSQLISNIN